MKVLKSSQAVFSLILGLFLLFSLAACDDDKPTTPTMNFGIVSGTVYASGRTVLPGVTVSVGDKSVLTATDGSFIISGLAAGDRVQVGFSKEGWIGTQKIVNVKKDRTSFVSATLFTAYSTTFNATLPIILDSWASLNIPAHAFVGPGGAAFTGTVRAEMLYLTPPILML
jgi:hypothetical protein